MEQYLFKIEGTIIRTPEGWKDFELTLKRDQDISGLLVSSTNEFTFIGNGYDILKQRFDNNYNDKVNVTIDILQSDSTYEQQYAGVILLTDIKFNLEQRTASATVEDASFQGAIQNNKNIKSFINAGLTKNGEVVSVPEIFNLDYFNAAGVYQTLADRRAYLLKEVVDFLVRFMTDDEVKGIESAYFDNVSNWEGVLPYITTGVSIRTANQDAPNISFFEVMKFLQRTHDLTFDFVTNTSGEIVMRIEERDFFFSSSSIDTMRDLKDLSLRIDSQKIASHLEIGNNTVQDSGNCSTTTRFFSFRKEDYSLRGKGNVDKLLDLTTDFVTDSNVIQRIITGATSFDDDIIVVLGTVDGTQAALFNDASYCSGLAIYNLGFTNDHIIDRQFASVPNSITKYLTAATTPSKTELGENILDAITTTNVPVIVNVQANYIDEQYGTRYDTTDPNNTFYDIPFAGEFSFEISIKAIYHIQTTTGLGGTAVINSTMSLLRFDSSFTNPPQEVVNVGTLIDLVGFPGDTVEIIHTLSATMTSAAGDRLRVLLGTAVLEVSGITQIGITIVTSSNTFFKCLGAATDAGTYKVFDPNSFKARLYTYEKNLPLSRTDAIRANPRNSIVINELSDTALDKTVWIEEMVNNIDNGATRFTTIN